MRKLTILIAAVTISCIATPHLAQGQTEKTLERFDGERTVESPYITYDEFEDISIDGRGRIGELLTVSSVDQAVRILGKPQDRKITQINSGGYKKHTELLYDGLRISFLETAAGGVQLELVEVTSPDHFLGIGGKKVRPGMTQSKLGAPLRKDLSQAKAKGTDDEPTTSIFIQQKEKKRSKGGERVLEYSSIVIEQNPETGEVNVVRFSRII
jgi:hypothetical protein